MDTGGEDGREEQTKRCRKRGERSEEEGEETGRGGVRTDYPPTKRFGPGGGLDGTGRTQGRGWGGGGVWRQPTHGVLSAPSHDLGVVGSRRKGSPSSLTDTGYRFQ